MLYFEIYNEITLLSCSVLLLILCDILTDNEKKYAVGWYLVAATLTNIAANYINLLATLIA